MRGRTLRLLSATGVLAALVALALSACSGDQEANKKKKSAGGGSGATNGQIVFRRYFDPDQTKGALFTMNPDGSHIRQITHPPRVGGTTYRRGLLMGRGSPSSASRATRARAGSWS
jgi:hypothetical protein